LLDHSDLVAASVLSGSASIDKLPIDPSRSFDLRTFNREFEPARTRYDWMSRDPAVVDAFMSDPLCGFDINARSVETMAASAGRLTESKEIAHIRQDLPIYLLAGEMDPINHGLEWLRPLVERYRAAGITSITER
jgi:alpha-beta hydrolase superfamily lysophospholipase